MVEKSEKQGLLNVRVYYEDTDAGGVVYHANILKFAERGRTEWLRTLGYDHPRLLAEFGLIFVVRHIDVSYLLPGRLDDLLIIKTDAVEMGNTSITMKQTVLRESGISTKMLAELKVTVVAMKPEGRAVRIPPQLRQIFNRISGTET